jgi:hypothetical protein
MEDWLLANWSILGQFGFWVALAAAGALILYGLARRSRRTILVSLAFLPALVFFLAFQPFLAELDQPAFWLATLGIWGGVGLAGSLILIGIVYRSSLAFAASAIAALPFAYYLFGYPAARAVLLVPVVLLAVACGLYWRFERRTASKTGVS